MEDKDVPVASLQSFIAPFTLGGSPDHQEKVEDNLIMIHNMSRNRPLDHFLGSFLREERGWWNFIKAERGNYCRLLLNCCNSHCRATRTCAESPVINCYTCPFHSGDCPEKWLMADCLFSSSEYSIKAVLVSLTDWTSSSSSTKEIKSDILLGCSWPAFAQSVFNHVQSFLEYVCGIFLSTIHIIFYKIGINMEIPSHQETL